MTAKYQFILLALFVSAWSARADLVMKQREENTNDIFHITVKVHDDKMRMDQRDDHGHQFSVIVDLKTHDAITLIPKDKSFLKRSGMEIKMAMDDERRETGGTNAMDQPLAPVMDTGKTAKVDGYGTKIYTWSGAEGVTEKLWVATNFPDYDSIRPVLAKIDRFNKSGPHENAQPELAVLPGMVVKSERMANGRTATNTLLSAEVQPVDASLFKLPADYSPWKPTRPQTSGAKSSPAQ